MLRYALGISSLPDGHLSVKSFQKDGHKCVVSEIKEFTFDANDMKRLRQECFCLVCSVAEKFSTVRVVQDEECDSCSHSHSHNCDEDSDCSDDGSCCFSDCSTDTTSILSDDSGSMYLSDESDIEPDDTDHLYEPSSPNPADSSDSSDDDNSVEEVYNEFDQNEYTESCFITTSDDDDESDVDNLICPGDVVEYRDIKAKDLPKRNPILTIVDSEDTTYIRLRNGTTLYPKQHAVRKIKMFCGATENLIPNPLAQWTNLDKCILQSGSLASAEEEADGYSDDEHDTEEQMPNTDQQT